MQLTHTAPKPCSESVLFGYQDRSVRVSREAYDIFLDRERALESQVAALLLEVDRLKAAVVAPAPNWISVSERMPEPGKPVLVFVPSLLGAAGKNRCLRAQYAADRTLEQSSECEGGIYDEELDTYWCEPGWYETNEYEETHWLIGDEPSHWMPLPEAPAQVVQP